MLLNVIVKDNNSLTLTTKSRISKVGDVKVSSERQKAAREIAFPLMSSEVPLKDIEKSPIKSMLSVRGQIVAVSTCISYFITSPQNEVVPGYILLFK